MGMPKLTHRMVNEWCRSSRCQHNQFLGVLGPTQAFCRSPNGTKPAPPALTTSQQKETTMKGILAYALGVPFVVIVILYMPDVF